MLKNAIQDIVASAMGVLDDIPVTAYYHSSGLKTYVPASGTFSEAGNIVLNASDISADAASNSLISATTDFTILNIPVDSRYFKIAGFLTSNNNGYARALAVETNLLTLESPVVTDEIAGQSVVLTGPFYKLLNRVLLDQYSLSELFSSYQGEGENILDTDQKAMIAVNDLPVTPSEMDYMFIGNIRWGVQAIKTDPANALWILRIRKIGK